MIRTEIALDAGRFPSLWLLVNLVTMLPMIVLASDEGAPGVPLTAHLLKRRQPALDAIEAGIRMVEDDETVHSVGRGGWANLLGEVELDAAVMDGTSLRTGAVGGLKGFLHPVSVARQVLERLPCELLVGEGAARFASEIGAEKSDLLTPFTEMAWRRWFEKEVSKDDRDRWPDVSLAKYCQHAIDPKRGRDTTVFLAIDGNGNVASATSTSGLRCKYPGRLGDSPIIGAGSYADSRYGACACTGAGEIAIRCCSARSVVLYMRLGMNVGEAVREAVNDIGTLQGDLLSQITLHAIDIKGHYNVVTVNGDASNRYWLWTSEHDVPISLPADFITISA
jgi:L-asparaginase / beta-aspartyl-peptidase